MTLDQQLEEAMARNQQAVDLLMVALEVALKRLAEREMQLASAEDELAQIRAQHRGAA